MRDSYEYCICGSGTFMKIKDYKRETAGEVQVETSTKEGNCKNCGKAIYIVEVKAIDEAV